MKATMKDAIRQRRNKNKVDPKDMADMELELVDSEDPTDGTPEHENAESPEMEMSEGDKTQELAPGVPTEEDEMQDETGMIENVDPGQMNADDRIEKAIEILSGDASQEKLQNKPTRSLMDRIALNAHQMKNKLVKKG